MELFEELKTAVKALLGNSTIRPGVGAVDPREITFGEIRSVCPSTTFTTGALEAPLGNSGLETKTGTLMVAGFAIVFEPVPVGL
jgi:hypothetical protein